MSPKYDTIKKEAESKIKENKGKIRIEEKIEQKILDILKEEKKNSSKINNEVMKLLNKEVIIDYCTNRKVNAKSVINKYLHIIRYLMIENAQLKKNEKNIKSELLQKTYFINELENKLKQKDEIIERLINTERSSNLPNDTPIFSERNQLVINKKKNAKEKTEVIDIDQTIQVINDEEEFEKDIKKKEKSVSSLIITDNYKSINSLDSLNKISIHNVPSLLKEEPEKGEEKTKGSICFFNDDKQSLFLENEETSTIFDFKKDKDTALNELENLIKTKKKNVKNILNYSKLIEKEFEACRKKSLITINEKINNKKENKNEKKKLHNIFKKESSFRINIEDEEKGNFNTKAIKMNEERNKKENIMKADNDSGMFFKSSKHVAMERIEPIKNNILERTEEKRVIENDTQNENDEEEGLERIMTTILKFRAKSIIFED